MIDTIEDSETPALRYANATEDESRSWSSAAKQLGDLDAVFIGIYRVSVPFCLGIHTNFFLEKGCPA